MAWSFFFYPDEIHVEHEWKYWSSTLFQTEMCKPLSDCEMLYRIFILQSMKPTHFCEALLLVDQFHVFMKEIHT